MNFHHIFISLSCYLRNTPTLEDICRKCSPAECLLCFLTVPLGKMLLSRYSAICGMSTQVRLILQAVAVAVAVGRQVWEKWETLRPIKVTLWMRQGTRIRLNSGTILMGNISFVKNWTIPRCHWKGISVFVHSSLKWSYCFLIERWARCKEI